MTHADDPHGHGPPLKPKGPFPHQKQPRPGHNQPPIHKPPVLAEDMAEDAAYKKPSPRHDGPPRPSVPKPPPSHKPTVEEAVPHEAHKKPLGGHVHPPPAHKCPPVGHRNP